MRPPSETFPHVVALAALVLSSACGQSDPAQGRDASVAVSLGAVAFAPVTGASAAPDERLCEAAAAEMVARLPRFPARAQDGATPQLELTGMWDVSGGEVALRVEAKLRGVEARVPIRAAIVASGRAQDAAGAAEIVRRATGDLGKALTSMFVLYGAGEGAWIRALDAAEPDEQMLALALLGDAKSRAAVPAIGAVLGDPREQVAQAAADALVAIGDRNAVPLLIAAIRRNDVRSEVRAIEAISKLGGNEARAYLEMTAIGHEIPEVRALSANALERLGEAEKKTP
jgi:hypothetical protein